MILWNPVITVRDCLFEDTTVLDQFTIQGMLPGQKKELLGAVDYLLGLSAGQSASENC